MVGEMSRTQSMKESHDTKPFVGHTECY